MAKLLTRLIFYHFTTIFLIQILTQITEKYYEILKLQK